MSIAFLFAAAAIAGLMLGLFLTTLAVRAGRHIAWALARRRDRKGHGGNLLEALARKIEGPFL